MKFLSKYLLKELSRKPCPEIVPRSGEKSKSINCYVTYINSENKPYLLVKDIINERLYCKKWNSIEQKFLDEDGLDFLLEELDEGQINITHFYGSNTIIFDGLKDFTINYFTKWIYLKINMSTFIKSIDQYFFNKRKIITEDRLSLLDNMLNIQLDKYQSGISFIGLMTELYSFKWLNHPNKDFEKRKLKLYLESLIESGDLKYTNDKYLVTGKAISTLEAYEKFEEKHVSGIKHQRKILLLTIIIAIATLLQTKIVNIPTLMSLG